MRMRRSRFQPSPPRCLSSLDVMTMGVDETLRDCSSEMMASLRERGYFVSPRLVAKPHVVSLREEAAALFAAGKFSQSFSEVNGVRVPKPGVHSIELDGDEWAACPHLLTYTREVLLTLPGLMNSSDEDEDLCISERMYGTKLAVATGEGASYPLHVDNVGLPDTRKLTVILYLNPDWRELGENGGELRLWTGADDYVDIAPDGGRMVTFWADQLVHEVLPCFDSSEAGHRYALTLWLVSENLASICDDRHPHAHARHAHFPAM